VVYDLEHHNPHEYLSEYERMMKFRSRIRDYRIVFDNKILFYCIIRNFAPVNTIYAYIKKGNFIALEPEITREGLFSLLRIQEKLVVKLFSAGGGEGFRLVEYNAGKYYVNRQECSQADMFQLLEKLDDCLIEKYCRQSDFENALSPYSVNTIRMVTMCNYLGGRNLRLLFIALERQKILAWIMLIREAFVRPLILRVVGLETRPHETFILCSTGIIV
jgi:hypothetical protein